METSSYLQNTAATTPGGNRQTNTVGPAVDIYVVPVLASRTRVVLNIDEPYLCNACLPATVRTASTADENYPMENAHYLYRRLNIITYNIMRTRRIIYNTSFRYSSRSLLEDGVSVARVSSSSVPRRFARSTTADAFYYYFPRTNRTGPQRTSHPSLLSNHGRAAVPRPILS